ncbi:MAG: rod-binding protein, partial [Gallionella sp.]|nr:rod-binding protein [Gallionella sp.]
MDSPLNATMGTMNASANLAMDTQSLAQLRAQASQSPDKALKAAAQQFEAVFMNMMLKSMREASSQEGLMDNDQSRMFTGMLDQQLSQNMSSRGIGLADMMVKQLSRNGQGMVTPPVAGLVQSNRAPALVAQTPAVVST